MANTINASLVNSVLANAAVTYLNGRLAFLPVFTADFSDEVRDIRSRTINVPVLSSSSAVQTNPTDFEAGDNSIFNAQVNLNHLSKTSYLTYNDLASGQRLEWMAQQSINVVANAIEAAVFGLINETNFPSTVTTYPTGAMPLSAVQTMWGRLKGSQKNFIAADSEFKNMLQANLFSYDITKGQPAYGFDYFGHTNNGFAPGVVGTGITSFAAAPQAIAVAAAIPQHSPQLDGLLESTVVTVPELGLSIQSNLWASTKTRNTYHSFDVLFGAAVADKTAMVLGKSI